MERIIRPHPKDATEELQEQNQAQALGFSTRERLHERITTQGNEPIILSSLSKELGVSRQRLSELYHELGTQNTSLAPLLQRSLSAKEELDIFHEIIRYKNEHLGTDSIAQTLGLTNNRVSQILSLYVEGVPRDPEMVAREKLIKEQLQAGKTRQQLQAEFGYSKQEVAWSVQQLHKQGEIPYRRRKPLPSSIITQRQEHVAAYVEEGYGNTTISHLMQIPLTDVEDDRKALKKRQQVNVQKRKTV